MRLPDPRPAIRSSVSCWGQVKIWPCCARGIGVTGHPQTGAAGKPEAARAFTCVNLLCGSDLDFSRVHAVSVRKRKTGCVRASRKRVDFTGLSPEKRGRGVFETATATATPAGNLP